ncbi:hypothetical protein DACRYDRAFT_23883 [Dacryopinax primogenitus]|uniref:Bifunctional lycopene cyclase/phytoene synthase n=1 Tax=Dacryopinax primogenitus (strain DJM 731) TaxID=1858805 RepID=M5G698_DACPD|nr:uncharacterized protein DACRYDRAFT_23883 [Dacryopinax primogenitus]EJT99292.1 hypothetical protein DACRYDRAFT_23883 [Dacryopinax primogenitus]
MSSYAEIHLRYTLPPCLVLFLLSYPFSNSRHHFALLFLLSVVILCTAPWDSYVIHRGIWAYPSNNVMATLFRIPVEEFAFFVIQTYMTTSLYSIITKPTFHPSLLPPRKRRGTLGSLLLLIPLLPCIPLSCTTSHWTYTALIVLWSAPFLSGLWYVSGPHLLRLPRKDVLIPILLPAAYLWLVDGHAIRSGIWTISERTKLGWELAPGLELEEGLFFLLSNTLLVLGNIALSQTFALADVLSLQHPHQNWHTDSNPLHTLPTLLAALLLPAQDYPSTLISHLSDAAVTLREKSKSFDLAAALFGDRCRLLLLSYYAFCRATDDFVDERQGQAQGQGGGEGEGGVEVIERFLGLCYPELRFELGKEEGEGGTAPAGEGEGEGEGAAKDYMNGKVHDKAANGHENGNTHKANRPTQDRMHSEKVEAYILTLPPQLQPSFSLFYLLVPFLPPEPVLDLVKGYEFDLAAFPVAGTKGEDVGGARGGEGAGEAEEERKKNENEQWNPAIKTEQDLIQYCQRVAGSVGVACTYLFAASQPQPQPPCTPPTQELLENATNMGIALQLVNIARDIEADARMGRSYVPSSWASSPSSPSSCQADPTTPATILSHPKECIALFRPRLLTLAFKYYALSAPSLHLLPTQSKQGARAAVAAYMSMGLLMRSCPGWPVRSGWTTAVKVLVVLGVLYLPLSLGGEGMSWELGARNWELAGQLGSLAAGSLGEK